MTPQERAYPEVLDGSRRARIAAGSGVTVSEVSLLVKQFSEVQKMMKKMSVDAGHGQADEEGQEGQEGSRRPHRRPAAAPSPFELPGLN